MNRVTVRKASQLVKGNLNLPSSHFLLYSPEHSPRSGGLDARNHRSAGKNQFTRYEDLNDWTYQYDPSYGRVTPAVRWLLIVTISAYVIQRVLQVYEVPVFYYLGLSLSGLKNGYLWQLVTYMFMHGPWLHIHILVNMLLLFMMGPETERALGKAQFYILYFVSGILGGMGWLMISAGDQIGATCVGASGAIFGVVGAFAALFPHRVITLLLFFFLPIRMRAWVLAVVMGLSELSLIFFHPFGGGVANAAHLAGGLAGYIYAYVVFRQGLAHLSPDLGNRQSRPHIFRRSARRSAANEAEIDRILDKIEKEGMQSLTPSERDQLHRRARTLGR